jgi:hypothetical protein
LFFAVVAVAQAADSNPLGKVIELLDGLAAKVTADGEREAKRMANTWNGATMCPKTQVSK